MNQKLTVGFFLFGCVIVTATILAFNHIRRLEELLIKQQDTIEIQDQAIHMIKLENSILKATLQNRY